MFTPEGGHFSMNFKAHEDTDETSFIPPGSSWGPSGGTSLPTNIVKKQDTQPTPKVISEMGGNVPLVSYTSKYSHEKRAMNSFYEGFEKKAYEYKHEARMLEQEHKEQAAFGPGKPGRAAAAAAVGLVGAVTGGTIGAFNHGFRGAAKGGAIGAGVGAGLGLLAALGQTRNYEEAKRVLSMKPAHRKDYLQAEARQSERLLPRPVISYNINN